MAASFRGFKLIGVAFAFGLLTALAVMTFGSHPVGQNGYPDKVQIAGPTKPDQDSQPNGATVANPIKVEDTRRKIVTTDILSGSNSSAVDRATKEEAIVTAESWLKANYLKDPDSYQYREALFIPVGEPPRMYALALYFRAKNGFGGYDDDGRTFIFRPDGTLTKTMTNQEFLDAVATATQRTEVQRAAGRQ